MRASFSVFLMKYIEGITAVSYEHALFQGYSQRLHYNSAEIYIDLRVC